MGKAKTPQMTGNEGQCRGRGLRKPQVPGRGAGRTAGPVLQPKAAGPAPGLGCRPALASTVLM